MSFERLAELKPSTIERALLEFLLSLHNTRDHLVDEGKTLTTALQRQSCTTAA